MPLLFFFLIFSSAIYANSVKINSVFSQEHNICIYNGANTTLNLYLRSKNDYFNYICIVFRDYSGVLKAQCGTGSVSLKIDNLRKNTIYYLADLTYKRDDNYLLHIKGDKNGLIASECPTIALSKIAHTSPGGIGNALIIAGVLTGILFFAGVIFALAPSAEDNRDFYE